MLQAEHISIYIDRAPAEVYGFASNPLNLPHWATGLARSAVHRHGSDWLAEAPFGKVRIRFADQNQFGVMDHTVELESGERVYNPLRVVANGTGSELVFTLFRRAGMSAEQFADDRRAVARDLASLKKRLESIE